MLQFPTESRNSRVLKIGLLAIVGIVLAVTALQLTCRTPSDVERIIESSPGLIEHDRFCRGIPLPPDFVLEARSLGGNSYTTAIGYTFRSRASFAEVRDFFLEHLKSKGWTQTNLSEGFPTRGANGVSFSKESYQASIYLKLAAGNDSAGAYSVYCAKVARRNDSLLNRR